MRNKLHLLGTSGILFFLMTYAPALKAGDFYLAESRSKAVLISGHDTNAEKGWPNDNFDGKNFCSTLVRSFSGPAGGPPAYTSMSTDECSRVAIHRLSPNATWTAEKYKEANDYFTEQMKLLWNYNAGKEFVSYEVAEAAIKSEKKNPVPVVTFNIYEYVIVYNKKEDIHTSEMMLELNYDYGIYHYVINIQGFPGKKEIVTGILMLKYLLEKAEVTERASSYTFEVLKPDRGALETKTLLLDRSKINPDLTEEKIQETYPFKFKFAETEEIEQTIIERKPGFAYVLSYPMLSTVCTYKAIPELDVADKGIDMAGAGPNDELMRTFMLIVIDAETGKTLSSSYEAFASGTSASAIPVMEKDLKMFVKRSK